MTHSMFKKSVDPSKGFDTVLETDFPRGFLNDIPAKYFQQIVAPLAFSWGLLWTAKVLSLEMENQWKFHIGQRMTGDVLAISCLKALNEDTWNDNGSLTSDFCLLKEIPFYRIILSRFFL